jgi:hypothetical protein
MGRQVDNKDRVLAALLTSNTRKEAAQKSGVSERTIYSYLQDPVFLEQYEAGRRELVKAATEQIQRGLAPAITALREITEDGKAGRTARVAAARALLEYGIRLSEITDIYNRLDKLEEQAREGDTGI